MFSFDREKAVESIIYLVDHLPDEDKQVYTICKMLYFADKTSLEKYGRFIFGETYCAMQNGATPSHAYDLLKEARMWPVHGIEVEGNEISVSREADTTLLSETDIECLDKIISVYGGQPNWVRFRDAHDEAYHVSWSQRGEKESVPIDVLEIAKLFDNSSLLVDYLTNRDSE